MPEIPFTQFMYPNGHKVETGIDRPTEVWAKAMALIAQGFRFEAEVLQSSGEISLTIADDEEDLAIQVCPNGPEVETAVDKLIMDFVPKGEPFP